MFIYLNIQNLCLSSTCQKEWPQLAIETIKHKITIVCVLDINGISKFYIHNLKKIGN
jgi:hypothetical protein